MKPLINILIRTSNRPQEFKRCIQSIRDQRYNPLRLIICTDQREADYLMIVAETYNMDRTVMFVDSTGVPYHWNFYCNNLKDHVTDGWFFYLDDDDYLKDNTALQRISEQLTDPREAVICQFMRGNKRKPEVFTGPEDIIRGKIGGGCIFLHTTQKNIAYWDGKRAADYRFIKAVSEKIPLKFVPTVVTQAGNNGRHGK